MSLDTKTLQCNLQALDDLLVRERHAIVYLQVNQLDAIQQDKIRLLKVLQQAEQVDAASSTLVKRIKVNNERNRMLLESGLQLIAKLQDNVFRRLALTYAARGRSFTIGAGSRILNRSA